MDGWIILDKDSGLFSRTAGARVARMFNNKKFGHIGTLDPMASGVLPIAIGNATKMIPFIEEVNMSTKEYLFGVKFGSETDTLDITGTKVSDGGTTPTESDIIKILPSFIGEQLQTPPIYSAVLIGGRRAYEMARKNQTVDIPPRKITIYELEYTGKTDDSYGFRVVCSRGTYVRAIARDIAYKLGTIATATMIRRTKSGWAEIKNAHTLDFLENLVNNGADIGKYLMPTDSGLGDIPVLDLDDKSAVLFRNGGFIDVPGIDGPRRVYSGDFIGIGRIENGKLKPKRII